MKTEMLPISSGPMLLALLEAMRPWQWTKNLLVWAPLFFAHRWRDPSSLGATALGFAAFCCAASALYLLNDILDREADRQHEKKRHRPIASGRLPVGAAIGAFAGLLAVAGLLAWQLGMPQGGRPFGMWLALYATQTTLYSFWLKHVVILDCLVIAIGFLLRVLGGGAAAGVECSSWILLCTFFFALFLACCKRREEVARHGAGRGGTRQSLKDYDLPFLDQLIAPLAALSILSYALYTVAPETVLRHGSRQIQATVPFVVFGVFRYLFLVHRRGEGMDTAKTLFRDPQLLVGAAGWVAVAGWAISA